MPTEVITKEDLDEFRKLLVEDIKKMLSAQGQSLPQKKWLRNSEVRSILKISTGTLQNLRVNGTLNPTKVGSIFFYPYEEIEKLLNGAS